jgi:glutathione S-transferase
MNTISPKPLIWGRLNSFNVQKVLFLCEELQIDHERIDAGMAFGVNKTPEYLKMNPNGLVPTLKDQGLILWESHAILRYLARKFDAKGAWYGTDSQKMSLVDQWLDWTNTTSWPPMRTLFWGWIRVEHDKRNYEELEASRLQMITMLEIMEAQLSQTAFIAGEQMSLADIPLALIAYRWFNIPIKRPVMNNLNRWYQAMSQTRGFKRYSSDPLS